MKKRILTVLAVVTLMSGVLLMQSALAATYSMGNGQKIGYNQNNSTYNNYYSVNNVKIQPSSNAPAGSGDNGTTAVPAAPSPGYVKVGNTKVTYGYTSNQNINYYPVVINKNAGTGSPSSGQVAPQPPAVQGPNGSEATHQLTSGEQKLISLVNEERKKAGLSPLAVDLKLSQVARIKSEDMRTNGYFSHTSPVYGSPFQMMKDFGITYKSAAENIAKTSGVDRAHTGFMNSEGHRQNILNPGYTHIGVGISGSYYTEMFIKK